MQRLSRLSDGQPGSLSEREQSGCVRLGKVMAANLIEGIDKEDLSFIWNGEEFKYPDNWEEVQDAWRRFKRQQGL